MPNPLNAVVDLSHHNGNVDLQAAKGGGIIGVIHKATQGLTGVDPMYHFSSPFTNVHAQQQTMQIKLYFPTQS